MKKFLLLLLTSGLFLSSCTLGKKNKDEEKKEDTPTVDPSGGGDEDPEVDPPSGPVYHDITLTFTVSGINTYEGDHSKIWINGDNVDCSKAGYESKVLTQDSENPNVWSVTLLNYELEQTLTYNLYYGGEEESSIEWNKGCNTEGDHENNRTLETFEDKFSYDGLTATFVVPATDGTLEEIKFVMTPLVKASSTSEGTALPEGVVVYAYNDFAKTTTKLVKEDNGTWSLTLNDVPTVNGEAVVQVNPVLGTAAGANYEKVGEFNRYGMGVYKGSAWEYWKDGDTYTFSSETLTVEKEILFREAPEVPAETYEVTFTTSVSWLDESETLETTAIYFAGGLKLKDDGVNWDPVLMEKQQDGTFKATFTDVAPGTYEYAIYACLTTDTFNWQTRSIEGNRNLEVTTSVKDFSVSSSWANQPGAITTEYELTVTVWSDSSSTAWPSSVYLQTGGAETALPSSEWKGNLAWDDTAGGFKGTFTFTASTVYVCFGAWVNEATRYVGASTTAMYAVSFTAETASFCVNVVYNGTDTSFAGATSNLVGCTIA